MPFDSMFCRTLEKKTFGHKHRIAIQNRPSSLQPDHSTLKSNSQPTTDQPSETVKSSHSILEVRHPTVRTTFQQDNYCCCASGLHRGHTIIIMGLQLHFACRAADNYAISAVWFVHFHIHTTICKQKILEAACSRYTYLPMWRNERNAISDLPNQIFVCRLVMGIYLYCGTVLWGRVTEKNWEAP